MPDRDAKYNSEAMLKEAKIDIEPDYSCGFKKGLGTWVHVLKLLTCMFRNCIQLMSVLQPQHNKVCHLQVVG